MVGTSRAILQRGVELVDVDIDGEIANVTINGVDVAPLIEAELDRRDPDRVKMRPTDPAGFREAWDIIERRWAGTVARARRLDPESESFSVRDCLTCILSEEWYHRQYAEGDLAALEGAPATD